MKQTYEIALELLDTRKQSRIPITPNMGENGEVLPPRRRIPSIYGMTEWLEKLGHSESDINGLNMVSVSGTKGKGSTCVFTQSFLRAHCLRTGFPKRVGLYTSPHLLNMRERIQIDGQPISEGLFTKNFFEVWDCLMDPDPGPGITRQPRYLQFLAILAFHTFIKEKCEAAIIEMHCGGENDSPNVVTKPVVVGITTIGLDHINNLGGSKETIAWHKTGICKPGTPAFSALQEGVYADVIRKRAIEKGTEVTFVPVDTSLPSKEGTLSVPVQQKNCSLAIEMAKTFVRVKSLGQILSPEDISQGIELFDWPGRFEIIADRGCMWYVDAAHNTLSLKPTGEWFVRKVKALEDQIHPVLIFRHFAMNRDGLALVDCIGQTLIENGIKPSHVIFMEASPRQNDTRTMKIGPDKIPIPYAEIAPLYASRWKEIDPEAVVLTQPTVEGALDIAANIGAQKGGAQILATGCLYMVGDVLSVLRK